MSELTTLLLQQLAGPALSQISQKIGADEGTTGKALGVAVPLLMGALARNAAQPEGAQALHTALSKDHDGGILDDVLGFLGNGGMANGAGILGHVLGDQRGAIEQGVAQASGLEPSAAGSLLETVAPLVMGLLGRTQQQQGLDADGLAGLLGGQSSGTAGTVLGLLNTFLDADKDGSAVDDLLGMAGRLFSR
jgi:hypothetical protein